MDKEDRDGVIAAYGDALLSWRSLEGGEVWKRRRCQALKERNISCSKGWREGGEVWKRREVLSLKKKKQQL